MRFVLAIVSLVVAAAMIGVSIAQQTILKLPDFLTASVSVESPAPVTVIDGATLTSFPNNQYLSISGSDGESLFAAYGRTNDVLAWIGDTDHNVVSYDPESGELTSTLEQGSAHEVPHPAGSDLWLAEYSGGPELKTTVNVSEDVSFLIVSDGTEPAPPDIAISWPVDNSTPWAGPLLIGGAVVLILGLVLLLWAIMGMRASRGPRRKNPRAPKLPKRPRYRPTRRTNALPSRRRGRQAPRSVLFVAPLAMTGVLLAGCASMPAPYEANPDTATPTATADPGTVESPEPAVSERQAGVILQRIADVAGRADKKLDADLAATRFAGPALRLRTANYTIREDDKNEPAVAAIPSGTTPQIVLPQQNEQWPRTVFLVVPYPPEENLPQLALMLVQDDPRSNYKVHYSLSLEPGAEIPPVAEAAVGARQLDPDILLLTVVPSELAAAYGDVLLRDEKSPSFALFDESNDSLREEVGLAAKKKRQKALPDTAKLTFSNAAGDGQPIVLATNDAGALVTVELEEKETVKPVETGATVSAPKNARALSGKSTSTTGLRVVYGDQLLFYVPAKTAEGEKAKLLGYASGMIGASEVKK